MVPVITDSFQDGLHVAVLKPSTSHHAWQAVEVYQGRFQLALQLAGLLLGKGHLHNRDTALCHIMHPTACQTHTPLVATICHKFTAVLSSLHLTIAAC